MTNNRAEGSSGGAPGTGIGESGDPSPTIANSHIPAVAFTCSEQANGTYRGKPAADGPKYKALGNSWAVNCARWIGRRIEMVEQIAADLESEATA